MGSNQILRVSALLGLMVGLAACASHESQVNDNYMYVPSRPPVTDPPPSVAPAAAPPTVPVPPVSTAPVPPVATQPVKTPPPPRGSGT